MEKQKVKNLFKFLPKSKHKAGEGLENGEYPFYTSSAVVNKYLDEYDYDAGKLIFATGGSASVHYANSKFAVSTDNFILEPNEDVNAKCIITSKITFRYYKTDFTEQDYNTYQKII